MYCSKCGLLNPDLADLCAGCGAVLADGEGAIPTAQADFQRRLAEAQEAVRQLRRYVPDVIAAGILHDQERLRGERREVTILFVDAVNFTRLSAPLDAESIFNLVNELLARLVECVHRYDGLVDKFTGDGLMAVFGAPMAHENDPELAIRAALDMQKAVEDLSSLTRAQLGAPLQIRVGLHSGPVVAGIIGTQQRAAYTAIGEAVNLAARLESVARPGHVLVSPRIYRQTQSIFKFQAMGMVQVKGIPQPVGVYEVAGDLSEPAPARRQVSSADFLLGRDDELKQLSDLLVAFLDDRRGRLVVIEGEAGMGKSQLISRWLSGLSADQATVWYGRALPYAQGMGFGAFRTLLQDAIRNYPPGVTWDARVSHPLRIFLWQILGLLEPEEQIGLRHLEPERVKQSTILALREWVLGEARMRPLVLVLEDFQWADDLSRDGLQALVNLIDEAPVLLGVTTRPRPEAPLDLVLPQAERPGGAPLCLALKLSPLRPEHGRELLGRLVDLAGMPELLIQTVLTRAEGNPFCIEEFTRMLIEKDILTFRDDQWRMTAGAAWEELEIPDTLRGLMMARVDSLPDDLRCVLRDAAVIGLQFDARLLEEVERQVHGSESAPAALEQLVGAGLLVERPEVGEQVYAFRHILTQESVYDSLLRSQRLKLHRTVAECIEHLYAADLRGQAEVLALHYDRANVHYRAMCYALLAGDRARERFANREAIGYYSRALQLSQRLEISGAERWQAAIGLGDVHQRIGEYERSIACYQAALEEWKEAIPEARAHALLMVGQVWNKRGDLVQAEHWLRQALEHLDQVSDALPELRARVYSEMGWLNLKRDDLPAAQEWLERGLALSTGAEDSIVLSSVLDRLGLLHYRRGELERSAEYARHALEHRERQGDIAGYARALGNLAQVKRASGDWEEALADYERAIDLCEQIGEVEGLAQASANLGLLYVDRGDWERAERNLNRSLSVAQRTEQPCEVALAHANLGRLYLQQERWDDGACHLETAISLCTGIGERARPELGEIYGLQAILCLEQGQIEAAAEWAERCRGLLQEVDAGRESGAVHWGRCEEVLGRVAQARGDLKEARQHLECGAAILRNEGSPLEAARASYWCGLVSLALQQPDEARTSLSLARQVFERLGAAVDLRRVEEELALGELGGGL